MAETGFHRHPHATFIRDGGNRRPRVLNDICQGELLASIRSVKSTVVICVNSLDRNIRKDAIAKPLSRSTEGMLQGIVKLSQRRRGITQLTEKGRGTVNKSLRFII